MEQISLIEQTNYFSPERDVNDVIQKQKTHYEFGKSTGWYRN